MEQAIREALAREFPGLEEVEAKEAWGLRRGRDGVRASGWAWAAPGLCLRFEALLRQEKGSWKVKQLNLRIRLNRTKNEPPT